MYDHGMEAIAQLRTYIGKEIVGIYGAGCPLLTCILIRDHLTVDAAAKDNIEEKDGLLAALMKISRWCHI